MVAMVMEWKENHPWFIATARLNNSQFPYLRNLPGKAAQKISIHVA